MAAPTVAPGQQRPARAPGVHGHGRGGGTRRTGASSAPCRPMALPSIPPIKTSTHRSGASWPASAPACALVKMPPGRPGVCHGSLLAGRSLAGRSCHAAGRAGLPPAGGGPSQHPQRAGRRGLCPGRRCGAGTDCQGLSAFEPVKGRSRALQLQWQGRPLTVVDDSYNANPDSVRAAIEVLRELPAPRVLVLGDMGEVGDQGRGLPYRNRPVRTAAGHRTAVHAGCAGPPRCWPASRGAALWRQRAGHAGAAAGTATGAGTGRQRAGQGIALHADGTRDRAAACRNNNKERTTCCQH